MYPYLIQGSNIVIVINSKSYTISKSHIAYEKLKDAIKTNQWDLVEDLVEPKLAIVNYGAGNVSIKGETFYWKGREMHNSLTRQIISMLKEDFPIEPMINFMDNLMMNPSKRAVEELYAFIEKGELPITPDGCFLAFKKVNNNFYDVHSGSVLNKPAFMMTPEDRAAIAKGEMGKVKEVNVAVVNGVTEVSMDRNMVDDEANNTCSTGLHFCSKDYLNSFPGDRIVILKINPADVVSIPADYNATKGRTCKYQVISELGVDPDSAFVAAVQQDATGSNAPAAEFGEDAGDDSSYIEQEYDSRGRPLSMTPNAIRKRKAKAAAKATAVVTKPAVPTAASAWPMPKK